MRALRLSSNYLRDPNTYGNAVEPGVAPLSTRFKAFPAQWTYATPFRIMKITFERDGIEREETEYTGASIEVLVVEQDPKDILTGPPDPGRYW